MGLIWWNEVRCELMTEGTEVQRQSMPPNCARLNTAGVRMKYLIQVTTKVTSKSIEWYNLFHASERFLGQVSMMNYIPISTSADNLTISPNFSIQTFTKTAIKWRMFQNLLEDHRYPSLSNVRPVRHGAFHLINHWQSCLNMYIHMDYWYVQ